MFRPILITGCSAGGKSTLLRALHDAGFATVEEPGRRIVRQQIRDGETNDLPWVDMSAFAKRALSLASDDLRKAEQLHRTVFFDRGTIDAAVALAQTQNKGFQEYLPRQKSYAAPVFITPPWPALFANDAERKQSFTEAVAEYTRIQSALTQLDHQIIEIPKLPVSGRVAFLRAKLAL